VSDFLAGLVTEMVEDAVNAVNHAQVLRIIRASREDC
jgi:hypothetical protein